MSHSLDTWSTQYKPVVCDNTYSLGGDWVWFSLRQLFSLSMSEVKTPPKLIPKHYVSALSTSKGSSAPSAAPNLHLLFQDLENKIPHTFIPSVPLPTHSRSPQPLPNTLGMPHGSCWREPALEISVGSLHMGTSWQAQRSRPGGILTPTLLLFHLQNQIKRV